MTPLPRCTYRGCAVRYVSGEDRPCSPDHVTGWTTDQRHVDDGGGHPTAFATLTGNGDQADDTNALAALLAMTAEPDA